MSEIKIVTIHISGPVSSGKSCVLSTVRELLEAHGYSMAVPDRAERNNRSASLEDAAFHERPHPDRTVFVLTEGVDK